MKKTILSLVVLFLFSGVFGQKRSNELQVLPFAKLDWYPEFTFNYGGRFSSDSLKMKGISWGININYKYALQNSIKIIAGIGYYRYSFSNLRRINSSFGVSDTRPIEVLSFNNFFYHTNSYRYNTISLNIGVEKLFRLNQSLHLTGGFSLSNYLTFQSVYKTNFDGFVYKKKGSEIFAHSLTTEIGFEKELGRLTLGPKLLIPVFGTWGKDEVFKENKNENRSKWLNGIGIGLQLNYPLTKK